MEPVRLEFAERYFRWALADAVAELDQGFPVLSRVSSKASLSFRRYVATLPLEKQRQLVAAMVKRFHPYGSTQANEALDVADLGLLRDADSGRAEGVVRRERRKGIKSREFLRAVDEVAVGVLPQPLQRTDPGPKMLGYETKIDQWVVGTWVSGAGAPFYFHLIRAGTGRLEDHISINSWMGISSMTEWNLAQPGDEREIAATMGLLWSRFLGGAAGLLGDLTPPTSGVTHGLRAQPK